MKAYKYHRYKDGARISMQSLAISETIIFIPELRKIIYKGYDGYHMRDYFGVCKPELEAQFIKEAEEYIADIKAGLIPAEVSDNTDSIVAAQINSFPPFGSKENPYSSSPLGKRASEKSFYVKTIGLEKKEVPLPPAGSNATFISATLKHDEIVLSGYQEIELDITVEDVQKITENEQIIKDLELSTKNLKGKFFK